MPELPMSWSIGRMVLMRVAHGRSHQVIRGCLQIPQQPLESDLIAVVVFPVGEVWDEILADLPR